MSLSTYLTGIADAIREKKGTSEPINAQNFATEIKGIETGGNDEELNIAYAKQMDTFNNILTGKPLVERDYTAKEIAKLDRILANITQGEVVNG